MTRVATKLTPTAGGGFSARKRIPEDVQEAYQRLYRRRCEERFNSGQVPLALATAKLRDWLNEVEARIENIRAERRGEGQMLTPMQARALAGEWYHWFTAKHLAKARSASYWEDETSEFYDEFHNRVWDASGEEWQEVDPLEVWKDNDKAKEGVRPLVADRAESAQFLHAKRLVLDRASHSLFLDFLGRDLLEALQLLTRRTRGDYSPDKWADQFPRFEGAADPSLAPWSLFGRWIAEAKPAASTVDRWRGVFLKLKDDFPEHSAAILTPEEAHEWARGLVSTGRGARTVQDVWVVACRTVFGWAVGQRLIAHNPFKGWRISVPRKSTTRETKAFTSDEIKTILEAAQAISSNPRSKTEAVRRWVPWLCAYTGARAGEITQLRGLDVIHQEGVQAIKITPEAGTVKNKKTRTVPLHEHLIDQGFLAFAEANGKGPLFYNTPEHQLASEDPTNPRKSRSVKAREHLAAWVRRLGVTDREIQPNHAWRHTFKQVGHRYDIKGHVLDAIVGHAPATVGDDYSKPTLKDKAEALRKFPRYELTVIAAR